jgi:hypothetical protein
MAIPVRAGTAFRNSVKASNPPADAPTPTIGKEVPREGSPAAMARFAVRPGLPLLARAFLDSGAFFFAAAFLIAIETSRLARQYTFWQR